jgi:hypothetical protein
LRRVFISAEKVGDEEEETHKGKWGKTRNQEE